MQKISSNKPKIVLLSSDIDYHNKLIKSIDDFEIIREINIHEALQMIKTSYRPQIIIVDQEMPADHIDLLKKVATAYSIATRIILTTDPKSDDIQNIIKSGVALMFIAKNDDLINTRQLFKVAFEYYKHKAKYIKFNKEIKELNRKVNELSSINKELFPQLLQIISGLVNYSEKSYYVSHSRALALTAKTIAEKMDCSDEEISRIVVSSILFAAVLNGLPDKFIGEDPLKMNDEMQTEFFELYNKYVNQIFRHNEFIGNARILYQIWERNDGSGLPNGIPSNQLAKAPQIIALSHEYLFLTYGMKKDEAEKFIFEKIDKIALKSLHEKSIKSLNNKPQRFSYELFSKFVEILKRRECLTLNPDLMIELVKTPPKNEENDEHKDQDIHIDGSDTTIDKSTDEE